MDNAERDYRWRKARERHIAAQLCLEQGFFSESVTLCYYACYQGMWIAVGEPPAGLWRHGGLINEFCRGRWRRPPAFLQTLAPLRKKLDRLYVYRIRSDYEVQSLSQEEAQQALDTVGEVFRIVAQHTGLKVE